MVSMELPPEPTQNPGPTPASPTWTQYDPNPKPLVLPLTWMERQKRVADALNIPDLEKIARALVIPVPWLIGLASAMLVVSCVICGWAGTTLNAEVAQEAAATATAANFPTVTPGPTATLAPSTPTLTPPQLLQEIVSDLADTTDFSVSVDDSAGVVTVNETLVSTKILTAYDCKQEIFTIQKAIWQQWKGHPSEVDVNIIGPLQDKYGNVFNGSYAHSMILGVTAPRFNWANLDALSAWHAYDEASIRSDI